MGVTNIWGYPHGGIIVHTTDGGFTWNIQHQNDPSAIMKVTALNRDTIWACGNKSNVFYSSNGGVSWSQKRISNDTITLLDIQFTDSLTGWMLGQGFYSNLCYIFRTTDRGITWNRVYWTVDRYYNLQMLDNQVGYVAGQNDKSAAATVWKTTNGGFTWKVIYRDVVNTHLGGVSFLNQNYGFACGFSYILKYSVKPNRPPILELGPIDTVAKAGTPFTVTYHAFDPDSGDKVTVSVEYPPWLKVDTLRKKITGLVPGELIDKKFAFKVTATDTKGASTSFTSDSIAVRGVVKVDEFGSPTEFYLSQNYPNPFNPSTTLKYSIPIPCQVRLTVLDILGREIVTLVDEQKFVGTYEVNFNASNLPSGIYFYRLTASPSAGGFSETKKMILIK